MARTDLSRFLRSVSPCTLVLQVVHCWQVWSALTNLNVPTVENSDSRKFTPPASILDVDCPSLYGAHGSLPTKLGIVIAGVAFNAIKFVIHGLWIQSDDLGGEPAPLTLMMHDCCVNSTVTVETAAGVVDRFQKVGPANTKFYL
ncbi:hypothetical protein EDD22DRAFT_998006 [Suillus occidentalis]|nr:hypothetical protein EDD22DRAFT_998006 [Suillus occidentalis]